MTPAGTRKAHRWQRTAGAEKQSIHVVHTPRLPQPRHTAHRLGRRAACLSVASTRAPGDRVASIASIYCSAMASADGSKARGLDELAARAALARLARRETVPWLHSEIARRLIERLAPLRAEPGRIVEWWAGPGDGDALLRERYPRAERIAVEPEGAWTERRRAAERRPWWSLGGRVAATVLPDRAGDAAIGRAQLVWANMVLPFVVDPPALMARWHALLDVEGVAVFSCLGPDTLRELRELYQASGWPAPTPTFIDMHDLGDMLVGAGFADPVLDQETLTLRWQSGEALLAELRQLGGNTSPERFRGLRTPRWRRRLLDALAERADADGSIGLSVEVAYGHGFKPAPRVGGDGPVSVSLDEMRAMVRRPRSSR